MAHPGKSHLGTKMFDRIGTNFITLLNSFLVLILIYYVYQKLGSKVILNTAFREITVYTERTDRPEEEA